MTMYKATDKWLLPYLRTLLRRPSQNQGPVHLYLCVCDHFEPLSPGGKQPHRLGLQRVRRWQNEFPKLAGRFADTDGHPPQHTFFFPEEEYHVDFLAPLEELRTGGFGDVEIHLHHRHDSADSLRQKLIHFRDLLHDRHGLLPIGCRNVPSYGFIHGNWALCNSRPDGDWCGVNEEIDVLLETGCYADFTFPSIPSPTQPRRFCNSIYYARNMPGQSRSHDHGRQACRGVPPRPDELLMIQGPVALNWRWRKWGILPRIEHADLCASNPPTHERLALWIQQCIHVQGAPNHIVVKLHTHGCLEANADVLLGDDMVRFHASLLDVAGTLGYRVHYVTARQLANVVYQLCQPS